MKARIVMAAAVAAVLGLPAVAGAQGIVGGAQEGARVGNRAAGPVGGAVGGVVGGVKGVIGAPRSTGSTRKPHRKRHHHR